MRVFVDSIGIVAPGLISWEMSRAVLKRDAAYDPAQLYPSKFDILPAVERRRSSATVRIALTAAQQALMDSDLSPDMMATVFSSSGGDGEVQDQIFRSLSSLPCDVSPTRFHNSVHNAAAGYWGIATKSQMPSTSLCAYDHSFAAGLLEAAIQLQEFPAVLLIAFDLPFPPPFFDLVQVKIPFAAAFILSAKVTSHTMASWDINIVDKVASTEIPSVLPIEFSSNPAARCLPMLENLACESNRAVYIEYFERSIEVRSEI